MSLVYQKEEIISMMNEWHLQETSGKENHLPSPYLDEQFERAREMGVIPKDSDDVGAKKEFEVKHAPDII